MPWESEQQDLDPATNDVIGDDGEAQTFDLLANREYEPLDEQSSPEKKRVQAYIQQQTYSLDFDSYLKRFRDEEKLGLIDKDGIIVKGTAFKQLSDSDSEGSSEEEEDSEEAKGPRKKKSSKFRVNTSYCKSELELLQHVIFAEGLKESARGGNLYWFALALNRNDFKTVGKNRFYWNRYPNLEYAVRKKTFCAVTNRMRRTFEK